MFQALTDQDVQKEKKKIQLFVIGNNMKTIFVLIIITPT